MQYTSLGNPDSYSGTSYGKFVDHSVSFSGTGAAEAAVADAANYILRNTEVIGGDLIMKRAHQRSTYSDTAALAGDLQIAHERERRTRRPHFAAGQ